MREPWARVQCGANNRDLKCVLHPRVLGCKTRLESRLRIKLTPLDECWIFQALGEGIQQRYDGAARASPDGTGKGVRLRARDSHVY